jgi:hypothetical protein
VPEHTNYVFKGDTLVLVKNYYSSVDNFAFERSDSAKFFIKAVSQRQLVLVPVGDNARHLARRSEYHYTNLTYIPAEKVSFKSLTLSLTSGDSSARQITINRQGDVAFSGKITAKGKFDKFTGKLTRSQSDTLQTLLQHSLLSRLAEWHQNVALTDVPELKLEVITTNGQLYRLQSQLIPANLEPLTDFILGLPERLRKIR